MKKALVYGAGGFIGSHLVNRLKSEGYWVRGVDLKIPDFSATQADEFLQLDLRNPDNVDKTTNLEFDEVYQLAADMGGAGFVFTGEHDADIMHNSALINLNLCYFLAHKKFKGKVFYSSSACMYPNEKQLESENPGLKESDAYPGNPDSEYGWEKLFSERVFLAYNRNYGLNVRIARFHNIYGPEGTYKGGREKAPAAMCRKVIEAETSNIEVWGDGKQTRSFLYIDDCIDAVRLLMESEFDEPINIGSEEMVTINQLAQMAIDLSGKEITIKNVPSNAIGVRGRNSDNTLIRKVLRWEPQYSLERGLRNTYHWIASQHGTTGN